MHSLPVYMASAHLWLLFSLYPFIARQCLLPTVKTGKSEHTDLTQNNILPSPESFVHLKGAQKVEIHLYIEILMSASFRLWVCQCWLKLAVLLGCWFLWLHFGCCGRSRGGGGRGGWRRGRAPAGLHTRARHLLLSSFCQGSVVDAL